MGYDPALVARGGAIICVPCLRREGRSPAAAVTADRRRHLLYCAARRSGQEVVEVPADGWCMLNAALRAASAGMTKDALLQTVLQGLVEEGEPKASTEGLGLLASAASAVAAADLCGGDLVGQAAPPAPGDDTKAQLRALFDELPKSLAHALGCT
jgi:hypothetical protein